MQNQLIKEETAILAKEAGFGIAWKSSMYYDPECLERNHPYDWMQESRNSTPERLNRLVCTPSQTLLQKWLREKKKVLVTVDIDPDLFLGKLNYHAVSREIGVDREGLHLVYPFERFQDYEEALEDGLLKTLKKLLKK